MLLAGVLWAPSSAHAAGPRLALRVLVVSDGGPAVTAITTQLTNVGVPFTKIDLNQQNRQTITADFLSTTSGGVTTANFQGVVLPNENPFGADSAEMAALIAYEKQFGIRQVDAATWANPAVGLDYARYSGPLDGRTATVTAAARADAFGYLDGPVPFDDNSPTVTESYGFVASPLPDDPATGSSFQTLVTLPAGDGSQGTVVGAYTHDGRTELVVTMVYSAYQTQFQALAPGIVSWLTKGLHLGYQRNYFALHVDDVFATGGRWHSEANCTPGDGCPLKPDGTPVVTNEPIRMVAADVDHVAAWQRENNFLLDMYFNGGGSDVYVAEHGSDPLLTAFQARKSEFRWANHTYTHEFLGCLQDFTVVPWKCKTNAAGAIQYQTKAFLKEQISKNVTWAGQKGFTIDRGELVTGEHSGFFVTPQQPVDNPNLAAAFTETGVRWAGSDNSRDPQQRKVGSAVTVPRHPINIFFNAATKAEEVDEYNWIYTSRANGGSGICEDNPQTTTCIAPLSGPEAFDTYIVPIEVRIALSHVLGNDPRPHYVHQSNFTEDRIIFPVLDGLFARYRAIYADNTPLVNQRLRDISTELTRQTTWRTLLAQKPGEVKAYVQDGKVSVTVPAGTNVPITAPEGTRTVTLIGTAGNLYGAAYAGRRSAYTGTNILFPTVTLLLPS